MGNGKARSTWAGRNVPPRRMDSNGGARPRWRTQAARAGAGTLFLLATGVGGWLLLSGPDADGTPAAEEARPAKAEGRPVRAAAKAAPSVEVPAPPEAAAPAARRGAALSAEASTNGFTDAQMRKWRAMRRPPPGYTNDTSRAEARPEHAVFAHPSENRIALYLSLEPGTSLVGEPQFGEAFRRDFLKSCEMPIAVSDDDAPEIRELKRAVAETKADLRARMEAGEDVCDVMRETHREFQRMAQTRAAVESLVRERVAEGAETEEDVDLVVAAANRMLEAQGVAPIRMTPVLRRALLRVAVRAHGGEGRRGD